MNPFKYFMYNQNSKELDNNGKDFHEIYERFDRMNLEEL